jgi:hypothetical protein
VASGDFWSSSSNEFDPFNAWHALLFYGVVGSNGKSLFDLRVWPVRGGPR